MSQELAKLICKTLEENHGAELKFTRRVEQSSPRSAGTSATQVVITADISGGGRWLECRMYEECAHEAMMESVECLRRARADDRSAPAAPKADYAPTEAEQAELASRTTVMCKRCLNTGVDPDAAQCKCLDPG